MRIFGSGIIDGLMLIGGIYLIIKLNEILAAMLTGLPQ